MEGSEKERERRYIQKKTYVRSYFLMLKKDDFMQYVSAILNQLNESFYNWKFLRVEVIKTKANRNEEEINLLIEVGYGEDGEKIAGYFFPSFKSFESPANDFIETTIFLRDILFAQNSRRCDFVNIFDVKERKSFSEFSVENVEKTDAHTASPIFLREMPEEAFPNYADPFVGAI